MVDELIAAGTPPAVAARIVAQAFQAGSQSTFFRNSGGIPVDEVAERRREYDRNRKRNKPKPPVESGGIPVESGGNSEKALTHKIIDKKVRARKIPCPVEWQPTESHFAKAAAKNIPRSAVLEKAEDMRVWAKSSGALKADWDATFDGFLRRDADRLRVAPTVIAAPVVPDEKAVEFFKKFGRWHRDYGPEPGMPGCRASPEILEKYGYQPKAA